MRATRVFIFTILFFSVLFLPQTFADDYTRWELPEGAKLRLGKGKISYFEGHLTTIGKGKSYQFSPDSTQLAVMTSAGIWLYDVMTGKEIRLSTGPGIGMRYNVVLSPDSQAYAIPRNHKIELWDLSTNQLKTTLEGHAKNAPSVAFSPDGQMLASTDFAGIIRLWDINNKQHRVFTTPHKIVERVMFSPDGKTIVSSRERDVRLWDTATGKFKVSLEDTNGIYHIVFNSDGTDLFGIGISRKEVRFWDPDTGKIRMRLGLENTSKSFGLPLALSPDGKTLAIEGKDDYTVQLWDTQTGQLKNSLAGDPGYEKVEVITNGVPKWVEYATKGVESIVFSPDGRTLAVGSDGEVVLWDPATGTRKLVLTGQGFFHKLLISPDGRTLAARNYDYASQDAENIYLWNIDTIEKQNSKLRYIIKNHNSEIYPIAFHPDGKTLVSAHDLEKLRLWDVETGQLKTACEGYPNQLRVHSVAFSPNGKTLASLSISSPSSYSISEILLWDATTGEYQTTLKGLGEKLDRSRPPGHGGGIVFSADGKTLISGTLDGTVRLWDIKTAEGNLLVQQSKEKISGHLKATLKGHTAGVLCVALSPDGKTFASGSIDKTVRLWDVHTRKFITTLEGHTKEILTVAFSPDGLTLATGCRDGAIHLWDPTTGKHKVSLIGNDLFTQPASLPRRKDDPPNITGYARGPVKSLVFSPDSKILVNGNAMKIHFWNMNTLQIKSTLSGHSGLNSLAFSPDGRTLASGSLDGTILIWEVKP